MPSSLSSRFAKAKRGASKRRKTPTGAIQRAANAAVSRAKHQNYGRPHGDALGGIDYNLPSTLPWDSPIPAVVNNNAACDVINAIVQGTGSFNRIGRKTYMKSVRLRASFVHRVNVQATDGDIDSNQMRIVVVWDKNPNSLALPNFNTIFGRTDVLGNENTHFTDFLRFDNTERFQVLADDLLTSKPTANPSLNATGGAAPTASTTGYMEFIHQYDRYVDLKNRETSYSATGGTITDISTGSLLVYYRSAAATNGGGVVNCWFFAFPDGGYASGSVTPTISHARLRYTS